MKTLEEVAAFHGHICPGLAIGYRVAQMALNEMGERSEDEEVVAIVENDSCAVDAVQVMTGCTFGKGNLFFRDHGKQVYTFIKRPSGKSLRISVDPPQPEETENEKEASQRYSDGDRSPEVLTSVQSRKSNRIAYILNAPDEELFTLSKEAAPLPQMARIHQSVRCGECGEKTMETRARLLKSRTLCIPCFEKALGK